VLDLARASCLADPLLVDCRAYTSFKFDELSLTPTP
jgi:hypothetical protein